MKKNNKNENASTKANTNAVNITSFIVNIRSIVLLVIIRLSHIIIIIILLVYLRSALHALQENVRNVLGANASGACTYHIMQLLFIRPIAGLSLWLPARVAVMHTVQCKLEALLVHYDDHYYY
jgi:hypothetical protein